MFNVIYGEKIFLNQVGDKIIVLFRNMISNNFSVLINPIQNTKIVKLRILTLYVTIAI